MDLPGDGGGDAASEQRVGGGWASLEHIEAVERWYAGRGLPATFYLSGGGPAGVDEYLAGRGYAVSGASEVWTAGVGEVIASVGGVGAEVMLADAPATGWFDRVFAGDAPGTRVVHEAIVRRSPGPRAFAAVAGEGAVVACGMCVAATAEGWGGIYCMATEPAHRRRGLARAVLGELARWARGQGVGRLYLQVMNNNAPARGLYAGVGFGRAYGYHYRVK